jgi:hypothetical protein
MSATSIPHRSIRILPVPGALQCPVQIVGKEAGRTSLERREIGALLLQVLSKKRAKSLPWIALECLSVATRLSVGNRVGANGSQATYE